MKALTKKKLVQLICKKKLQPLMQKVYLLGLTGMNYGNANFLEPEDTGEAWAMDYIANKLKFESNTVVFDVGANTGKYALLVLARFKNLPTIYAFEPSKQTYNILKENTARCSSIKPFNTGLGEKEESLTIYANFQGSGATTLYGNALNVNTSNEKVSEQIELITLDAFCNHQNIETIHFLKIDVEGHELHVLNGGASLLSKKSIHFIQFEFGSFHVYSKTFFKDFWDLLSPFYTIYRIICDGLLEITNYSENLEIFRTANFLAELKNINAYR